MQQGMWIWKQDGGLPDEYVQFRSSFVWKQGAVALEISADTDYMVYVNGEFAGSGQYQDYPEHRVKDRLDIGRFLKPGENALAVLVWYMGFDCLTYTKGEPGLWYQVLQGTEVLDCSGTGVLCRPAPDFVSHREQIISPQLGYNCALDFRGCDGWKTAEDPLALGFVPAAGKPVAAEFFPRPVEKLVIGPRTGGLIVQQGLFCAGNSERESVRMDEAFLAFRRLSLVCGRVNPDLSEEGAVGFRTEEPCDGIYLIVDLGRESCGYLDLSLCAPAGTDVWVGYGEHLADGRVRCAPSIRNFSFAMKASGGTDCYFNAMRRLGLRYLQLFVAAKEFTLFRLGIRPADYPVTEKPVLTDSDLRRKIYDISVRTLRLCMHEHYEDCPWREQALYTTDSRNQILAGYYAFGETKFPRACFELMLRGVNEDGLLNLCFPAGAKIVIPFFNYTFFLELKEYLEHTGDTEFFALHERELCTLMDTHLARLGKDGLVRNFIDPDNYFHYWNFYEWKPMLNGNVKNDVESEDAILNAFLSMAVRCMADILRALGKTEEERRYRETADRINAAIRERFFDAGRKVFLAYRGKFEPCVSALANSVCVLCGAAEGLDTAEIERVLTAFDWNKERAVGVSNVLGAAEAECTAEGEVIGCTLSMMTYQFDALLRLNREKYAPWILKQIDEIYFYMISCGATTFWETLVGESDFDFAGSLCHGWSAMPVYYYHILGAVKEEHS